MCSRYDVDVLVRPSVGSNVDLFLTTADVVALATFHKLNSKILDSDSVERVLEENPKQTTELPTHDMILENR